jgi:chorismate mutase
MIKKLYLLGLFLLICACSKEEFAPFTQKKTTTAPPIVTNAPPVGNSCSNFTLVKPPVDFLFVWDNSSSQVFITPETKAALNNVITSISDRFDYHIMLAPLLPKFSAGRPVQYVIASNDNSLNLPASQQYMKIPYIEAPQKLDEFTLVGGTIENGYDRVIDLLNLNRSNNIFRQNAYTIVVVMSNEDETSDIPPGGVRSNINLQNVINTKFSQIKQIRDSLNSIQFRFISLVAHKIGNHSCSNLWDDGISYRRMSKKIYDEINPPANKPTDQNNRLSVADSYSICNGQFLTLFDGINSTIQEQVIQHVYNYWPLASTTDPVFDPGAITVTKNNGQNLVQNDLVNGFRLLPGIQVDHPTRQFPPPPGERFTGYLIELFGNGRVTFPECINVRTQSPAEYYGYLSMNKDPDLSSIQLTIDGVTIPQSNTNGWEYIGFIEGQNIKVKSRLEPNQPGLPPIEQTGYFIKLHGNAIFTNGSSANLLFKPRILP